jgi:Gram-negative bacterial TonB protein C-terminal
MNCRLIRRTGFRARHCLRTVAAIAAVLFFSCICRAQLAIPLNKPPAQPPAPTVPVVVVTPPMATTPAMDFVAGKLAAEIAARNMTGIVVVGLSGPDRRITKLGIRLRALLSDSLAKQSAGVKVPDEEAIRDVLHKNRIADDMLYSNSVGGWIAKRMNADGYATARIHMTPGIPPKLVAELFVCTTGVCVDSATIDAPLTLTPEEFADAGKDFEPTLNVPVAQAGVDGVTRPKCVSCPMPVIPPELRTENFQGASRLLVTVLSDGTPYDIFVVNPAGHGLDTLAIDAVLGWKFSPAHDTKDSPVAAQMELDIPFKIEGVPVKKVEKKPN